ncbi:MAG: hypothetical protein ACFFG0_51460 [Candidatus Thorarchaeota archaeon]
MINFCKENEISIEAYSPLTHRNTLDNHLLEKIAKNYDKSIAQILIRRGLQHTFLEIPKFRIKNYIIQNSIVLDFLLVEEDMKKLDKFDAKYRYLYDTSK